MTPTAKPFSDLPHNRGPAPRVIPGTSQQRTHLPPSELKSCRVVIIGTYLPDTFFHKFPCNALTGKLPTDGGAGKVTTSTPVRDKVLRVLGVVDQTDTFKILKNRVRDCRVDPLAYKNVEEFLMGFR